MIDLIANPKECMFQNLNYMLRYQQMLLIPILSEYSHHCFGPVRAIYDNLSRFEVLQTHKQYKDLRQLHLLEDSSLIQDLKTLKGFADSHQDFS